MTLGEHGCALSSRSDASTGLTGGWAWLVALALLLSACVVGSPRMRPVRAPEPLRPVEGYGMVVFLQPSDLAVEQPLILLDGQGRFLGDSLGLTYFAAQLPPGEHLFIGVADQVTALRATVEAEHTTYVLVSPSQDAAALRYDLQVLAPGDEQYKRLDQWLVDCTQLVSNESAGQAHLRQRADEVHGWIQQGEQLAGPSASASRSAQNSPSQ